MEHCTVKAHVLSSLLCLTTKIILFMILADLCKIYVKRFISFLISAGLLGPSLLHPGRGGWITGKSLRKASWVSRCAHSFNRKL